MKRKLLVLGIIGIAAIVIGYGSPVFSQGSKQAVKGQKAVLTPKFGGVLKMFGYDSFSLYPPTMTGQTDGQQSSVCLESLFRYDEKGNVIPLLGTGWKADAQAKIITITLRKGVKFHDGSDFNAEICKWNLEKTKEKRPELKAVASVDVIDPYTIRLNLNQFSNLVISHLASDSGRMVSKAAFEKNGGLAWAEKNPVGTGPFQFVSFQKSVALIWKRFDDYWGGKPYLDGIEMRQFPDPVVGLMTFKAGDIHTLVVEPKFGKELESEGKSVIVVPYEGQLASLAGNSKDPKSPFADIRVRQAISYAVDFPTITKALGYGYYKSTNQWSPTNSWSYNPNVVGYPYNPAKAKQLLAAAGYPNGFKTTMHYFALLPIYTDEMTAIQRYLKKVGIDATLDPLQRPKFAEMASLSKGWEGIVRTQAFTKPDVLASVVGTASKGGTEFSEIIRPQDYVDLYESAVAAADTETKTKLTKDLMKMAIDKYCLVSVLNVAANPIAKSKKLHDDGYGVLPNRYLSPKAWLE
jgi:peptide/nickel transport system substrate-binding protein